MATLSKLVFKLQEFMNPELFTVIFLREYFDYGLGIGIFSFLRKA